jgi:hypothetical protein
LSLKESKSNNSCEKNDQKSNDSHGTSVSENIEKTESKGGDNKRVVVSDKGSEISTGQLEKVGEKVEGVNQPAVPVNITNNNMENDFPLTSQTKSIVETPEDLIREIETRLGKSLPKKMRNLVSLTANINLGEGRGITVKDLQSSTVSKDMAEKKIYQLKSANILVPLTIRYGKMKQYALSNYVHTLESKFKNIELEEILPGDIGIWLAKEMSKENYVYHNVHLETHFNYKEDFSEIRWQVPSMKNKQKVQSFKLAPRRNCTFTLSPTGNVRISIECTLAPFRFHSASGLIEFFVTCGQILNILQTAANNRINVVPKVGEWYLRRFDYNKDVSIVELQKQFPQLISWSTKGQFKIAYMGTIFQIYFKEMPFIGECVRMEGQFSTNITEKLSDKIPEIVKGEFNDKHPFTTLEELLLKGQEVKPEN